MTTFAVVVPTVGRESLTACLAALAGARGPLPEQVIVVDDRRAPSGLLGVTVPDRLASRVEVFRGSGHGPAAARNVGWRATDAEWVVFVDDDVLVGDDWFAALTSELVAAKDSGAAGVQGRLTVPLPAHRRPTDWERNVAGLADARWATADMAYRRDALAAVGGFDERFRRAYREDADLALRLLDAGHQLVRGERRSTHLVRPAPWWVSLRTQAGNADDPVMRRRHGAGWRERAGAHPGRRPRHLAITAAGLGSLVALSTGRRRVAALLGLGWLAGTAEFAAARIAPGPRDRHEVAAMLATSAALPPVATAHWLYGVARATRTPALPDTPHPVPATSPSPSAAAGPGADPPGTADPPSAADPPGQTGLSGIRGDEPAREARAVRATRRPD